MTSKAHHRSPAYARQSRLVRAAANADPATRCWRCGRTLPEHPSHKTGAPPRWTAGHVNDGQLDGPLAAEASTCNYTAGARLGAARSHAGLEPSRTW